MRDTNYAKELCDPSVVDWERSQARLEKLYIKKLKQEEIRFSWWKNGKMMQRPLDLTEADLLKLLHNGFDDVFSDEFLIDLKLRIEVYLQKQKLKK